MTIKPEYVKGGIIRPIKNRTPYNNVEHLKNSIKKHFAKNFFLTGSRALAQQNIELGRELGDWDFVYVGNYNKLRSFLEGRVNFIKNFYINATNISCLIKDEKVDIFVVDKLEERDIILGGYMSSIYIVREKEKLIKWYKGNNVGGKFDKQIQKHLSDIDKIIPF